jgi:hypothetical protein
MRRAALISALLFLGACGTGGQLGENGLVRFSTIVDFPETDDFTAPVAVGRTVFLALQHPNSDPIFGEDNFPELTLRVEDPESAGEDSIDATVFPMGFAQYGVILERTGSYRFVAESKGEFLDAIIVEAAEVEALRLSNEIIVTTSGVDPATGLDCVTFETIPSLDGFVLHPNQSVDVAVVPTTGGAPMLGLLGVFAEASEGLFLDTPFVGPNSRANSLSISPTGALDGTPLDVRIQDQTDGKEMSFSLATDREEAPVSCQ